VFTYQGKPVARTTTKAWYAACKRAGIESFRWHDLRHTWASWHVQNGTSSQELMELGGWSCMEMVLRYAHLGGEHLKSASRRIERVKNRPVCTNEYTKSTQSVSAGKLRLVVSNWKEWWPEVESNHRHEDFQSSALPTELSGHF